VINISRICRPLWMTISLLMWNVGQQSHMCCIVTLLGLDNSSSCTGHVPWLSLMSVPVLQHIHSNIMTPILFHSINHMSLLCQSLPSPMHRHCYGGNRRLWSHSSDSLYFRLCARCYYDNRSVGHLGYLSLFLQFRFMNGHFKCGLTTVGQAKSPHPTYHGNIQWMI